MFGPHEVTVSVGISAPPKRVWELITDISLMPRFSTELLSTEWAEGFGGSALGAQFLGTNRHPAIGEWTTRSEIIEFDPLRGFAWAVGDPGNPTAVWRFSVSPTAKGTQLGYAARIGPGPSGVTMLIDREPARAGEIVRRRLAQFEAGMRATVAGIREIAEG
jgi:hypothetical protein